MKLLLITGAGASRNLSVKPEEPMPLMADWRQTLCDSIGHGFAVSSGLDQAETAQKFEETLGALFRWGEQLPLAKRFADLTRTNFASDTGRPTKFKEALQITRKNLDTLLVALHKSLFEEFGPARISNDAAERAYQALFSELVAKTADGEVSVVCATTNYDRSLEIALEAMGRDVRTGFKPHSYRTQKLEPRGLGEFEAESVALIYLHGAVGWYKKGRVITSQSAEEPYTDALGIPAVLYPSLDKDVEKAETAELWTEFDAAVAEATHIFVLGHGLNDDHLVAALRKAKCPIAVTVYPGDDDGRVGLEDIEGLEQTKTVLRKLPKAHPLGVIFGPKMVLETGPLEHWLRDLDPWHGNPPKPAVIRAA